MDIQRAVRAELPALRFEYKSGPLRYLVNNGHTLRVNYHDTPSSGNFFLVGGKRYQLTQFHFHRPNPRPEVSHCATRSPHMCVSVSARPSRMFVLLRNPLERLKLF